MTTKLKPHTRQSGATKDSTPFPTGFWKITVLPLCYYLILEASKIGSIASNETMLEGTVIMCEIFGREMLKNPALNN